MTMHKEDFFYQTIDFISGKGHLKDIQLSAPLVLPLIYQACEDKLMGLNQWKGYLKKTLEIKVGTK